MKAKKTEKQFYMHKIANLLNIGKIVTIHYQALTEGYVSKPEKHDFWEIIYADKEDAIIVKESAEETLKQGEMIFIRPNQTHYVKSGNNQPNIFIISFVCRSESMHFYFDKKYSVPSGYRYLLQNIMAEATETFRIPDFDPDLSGLNLSDHPPLGGEQVIKNSLELLLIYLLREAQEKPSAGGFFISKISASHELQDEIVKLLTANIFSPFELDNLCDELHYSKTFLCSFFKEKTGQSIYRTYLKMKIDEAKKLIRKKHTFAYISEKLCFDSVSHFTRIFKKYVGMTPSEYKLSIK